MKKNILIIGILLAVFITGWVIIADLLSYKTVIVSLENKGDTYAVKFYKNDDVIKTLNESGDLRLKAGEYSYQIDGKQYSDNKIPFTVEDEDVTLSLNPNYSPEYMAGLLETEMPKIERVLTAAYPKTETRDYKISELNIVNDGKWAAGKLAVVSDYRDTPDYYRFILKKVGDSWDIVVPPQILIKKDDYKDVPAEIIYSLYKGTGLY